MATLVLSWGYNEDGQLGMGAMDDEGRLEGDVVSGLSSPFATLPSPVLTPPDIKFVEVSCGSRHTLALTVSGCVYSWGWGHQGQLGHGDMLSCDKPQLVEGFDSPVAIVSAGGYHSCCLTRDGVWTFGSDQYGQLGKRSLCDSVGVPSAMPLRVDSLDATGLEWIDARCGGTHTAALSADGTMYTWGRCDSGQLGTGTVAHGDDADAGHSLGTAQPARVLFPPCVRVDRMSLGAFHSACVDRDGALWTFGKEDYGMLGFSLAGDQHTPRRVEALSHTRTKTVSCGGWHTVAVSEAGVFSFGRGEYGRLGLGDSKGRLEPARVTALDDVDVVRVSCGGSHTLVLAANGAVFSFGRGDHGRLGVGSKVTSFIPLCVSIDPRRHGLIQSPAKVGKSVVRTPSDLVPPTDIPLEGLESHPTSATFVSAGGSHSCALVSSVSLTELRAERFRTMLPSRK